MSTRQGEQKTKVGPATRRSTDSDTKWKRISTKLPLPKRYSQSKSPPPNEKRVATENLPFLEYKKSYRLWHHNDNGTRRYDSDDDNGWGFTSWCEYLLVTILATLLLVAALFITLFWMIFYRAGFGWRGENHSQQFNLHPVLMVAGFITLSGFSILFYRLCRCMRHIYVKLFHMFFHAAVIPCAGLGFLAVYDSFSQSARTHFYSLHTWLGIITIGMFMLQFIVGFIVFLVFLCCENRTYDIRSVMVPLHASFGLANFMMSIATCLTGLVEYQRQDLLADPPKLTIDLTEHYIINTLAVILVAIGFIISVAVRRSNAPCSIKVYVKERAN